MKLIFAKDMFYFVFPLNSGIALTEPSNVFYLIKCFHSQNHQNMNLDFSRRLLASAKIKVHISCPASALKTPRL